MVFFGFLTGQALTRAANGETLVIQQGADLANDDDILALVVTAIAAAFNRAELGELLFPVSQHVRLHVTQLADFANGEVALAGDWRQFVVVTRFQHVYL